MNRITFAAVFLLLSTGIGLSGCAGEGGPQSPAAHAETPGHGDHDGHAGHGHAAVQPGGADPDGGHDGLYCVEHDLPETECGICRPELADGLLPGQGLRIRLPSVESAGKAGIAAGRAGFGPAGSAVVVLGRLEYDRTRYARVTAAAGGVLAAVHGDVGRRVERGDLLAELRSPRLAGVQAELLAARAEDLAAERAVDRESELFENGVSSERDLLEARARHERAHAARRAAEAALRGMGLADSDLAALTGEGADLRGLPVRAPLAGTVVAREAVAGEMVEAGRALFAVADLDRLWAVLSVPEASAGRLRPGQEVVLQPSGFDGPPVTGRLTWIAGEVDPRTRMVEARAEVANPDRTLRSGMFVEARVAVGAAETALTVPRGAVHRFGGRPFVFVRHEPGLFEVRRVEARPADGDRVAVTAGLDPAEDVVLAGSFLVKSEFQKSRLGAGCAD